MRISGNLRVVRSSVGTYGVSTKRPLPRTNPSTCMIGVPVGAVVVARPLHAADLVERARTRHRRTSGWSAAISSMISARVGRSASGSPSPGAISQAISHSCLPVLRRHHRADPVDPALGVGERAVLLQERRAGQEDVRERGGLVEEQVLDDDEVHRRAAPPSRAWCSGRTGRCPRPGRRSPGRCRRARRRTCWGSAGPARARWVGPTAARRTARTASSETCR